MCPYCKADFSIYFHGPASAEQKLKSEAEDNEQALALERSRQVPLSCGLVCEHVLLAIL